MSLWLFASVLSCIFFVLARCVCCVLLSGRLLRVFAVAFVVVHCGGISWWRLVVGGWLLVVRLRCCFVWLMVALLEVGVCAVVGLYCLCVSFSIMGWDLLSVGGWELGCLLVLVVSAGFWSGLVGWCLVQGRCRSWGCCCCCDVVFALWFSIFEGCFGGLVRIHLCGDRVLFGCCSGFCCGVVCSCEVWVS